MGEKHDNFSGAENINFKLDLAGNSAGLLSDLDTKNVHFSISPRTASLAEIHTISGKTDTDRVYVNWAGPCIHAAVLSADVGTMAGSSYGVCFSRLLTDVPWIREEPFQTSHDEPSLWQFSGDWTKIPGSGTGTGL